MDEKSFASRLRELRKQKGLSQLDLAKLLDVDDSSISQYETGKRKPDLTTLTKLTSILGTTTDYLTGISDISITPVKTSNNQDIELFAISERHMPLVYLISQLNDENRKMAEQMLKVMVDNQKNQ